MVAQTDIGPVHTSDRFRQRIDAKKTAGLRLKRFRIEKFFTFKITFLQVFKIYSAKF